MLSQFGQMLFVGMCGASASWVVCKELMEQKCQIKQLQSGGSQKRNSIIKVKLVRKKKKEVYTKPGYSVSKTPVHKIKPKWNQPAGNA